MYDCHDDSSTDNTASIRGFYIKKDVYKIAVCGKYIDSSLSSGMIQLYTEDQEDYISRRNALQAYPVTNVKYEPDKFTFDTNFDSNRFVVSRVAFDKGWSITATNNETGQETAIKVYKGNGGFVSFVAPKGNYSYKMVYQTPYLTGSYLVSAFSITGFFTSLVGYHIYQNKKKRHCLDQIYRENY